MHLASLKTIQKVRYAVLTERLILCGFVIPPFIPAALSTREQIEPFMPFCSIKAFDASFLSRFAGLDIKQRDFVLIGPVYYFTTDVL